MRIYKLTDLEAWKEAMILTKIIYKLIKKFPMEEKFNTAKHMRENARGIPANIGEGFGRYFYKDSLRFYGIAKGCLGEQESDLHLSFALSYITSDEFNEAIVQLQKVSLLLNGLISNVSGRVKTPNKI